MSEIRLATLSTVMLSREDLREAIGVIAAAPNNDGTTPLGRVSDALWSIYTHTGVQAIACTETVEEAE